MIGIISIGSIVGLLLCWAIFEYTTAPLIQDVPDDVLSSLIKELQQIEYQIIFEQSTMSDKDYQNVTSRFWQLQNLITDLKSE